MNSPYDSQISLIKRYADPRFIVFIPSLLAILFSPDVQMITKISDIITLLQILWVIYYASRSSLSYFTVANSEITSQLKPLRWLGPATSSRRSNIVSAEERNSHKNRILSTSLIIFSAFILWWSRSRAFLLKQDGIVFSDSSIVLFAFWSTVKVFTSKATLTSSEITQSSTRINQQNILSFPYSSSTSLSTKPLMNVLSVKHPSHSHSRDLISTNSSKDFRCDLNVHRVGKRSKRYMKLPSQNPKVETSSVISNKRKLPFQALFEIKMTPRTSSDSPLASCTTLNTQDPFQQRLSGYQVTNNVETSFLTFSVRLYFREKEKKRLLEQQYLWPIPVNKPIDPSASAGSNLFKSRNCTKPISEENGMKFKKSNKLSYTTLLLHDAFYLRVVRGALRLPFLPLIWMFGVLKLIKLAIKSTFSTVKIVLRVPVSLIKQFLTPSESSNHSTVPRR